VSRSPGASVTRSGPRRVTAAAARGRWVRLGRPSESEASDSSPRCASGSIIRASESCAGDADADPRDGRRNRSRSTFGDPPRLVRAVQAAAPGPRSKPTFHRPPHPVSVAPRPGHRLRRPHVVHDVVAAVDAAPTLRSPRVSDLARLGPVPSQAAKLRRGCGHAARRAPSSLRALDDPRHEPPRVLRRGADLDRPSDRSGSRAPNRSGSPRGPTESLRPSPCPSRRARAVPRRPHALDHAPGPAASAA